MFAHDHDRSSRTSTFWVLFILGALQVRFSVLVIVTFVVSVVAIRMNVHMMDRIQIDSVGVLTQRHLSDIISNTLGRLVDVVIGLLLHQ